MATVTRISKGGQISIPAEVRRRWGTEEVSVDDRGDSLVLRPIPADPIRAAMGSLRLPEGVTGDDLLRQIDQEEEEIYRRKWGA